LILKILTQRHGVHGEARRGEKRGKRSSDGDWHPYLLSYYVSLF